jgi:GNAT superfamily N-acetyltransferase
MPSGSERAAGAGKIRFAPATIERWPDLVKLFGPRGACAGCWCMWWRMETRRYRAGQGAGNRRALARVVRKGPPPGVLAYAGGEPIGWCAVAPRSEYPRLARSRVLAPVDERPVWSVTCLFVSRAHRDRGLTVELLRAAAAHAARHGAEIVEGYPVEPRQRMADVFAYTGLASAFRKAGFTEVARRSPTRPVMRRIVRPARAAGRR